MKTGARGYRQQYLQVLMEHLDKQKMKFDPMELEVLVEELNKYTEL